MRVGIIALLHESNTFISAPTEMRHFEENMLLTGKDIHEKVVGTHHEVGGFFAGLEAADIEAVPIFSGRAVPFGTITAETFDRLLEMMFAELEKAGPLDGLLVAPHGATVAANHPDADGYWLTELRKRVGDIPIIGTLDPHANLSAEMVAATDALVAYRSNPHLDQRARGQEAAELMARTLRGEIKPTQAASFPPMSINIECQQSTVAPCLPLYELANQQLDKPGVLSNSIYLSFPYSDVAEMGSAISVVTDNDPQLAQQCAGELADYLWLHREEFDRTLIGIEEALDRCEKLEGPICLLDMGDNVGGGSPGDSTLLAIVMHQRKMPRTFVLIYDPESVEQAQAAGAGSRVTLRVGAKTDSLHGAPLEVEFTIDGLYDGLFKETEPRHGGWTDMDQGATAVVHTDDGLTVMLTSLRMPPFSIKQLTTFNVDPADYHILVAKGVNAPVAAYEPVCKHLLRVNTPGVTTADMKQLDFQQRRRPMFPFERETTWQV